MKVVKINTQSFSFDDLEEGLMLAGYITPVTIEDLSKIEALEEYERELNKAKAQLFFKRVVLAAKIASELHAEPTFGRIKFQKLVYLCENVADMELNERYSKLAAGPFDPKFMHSINKEFLRNKWFKADKIKNGKIERTVYIPLENLDGFKGYYNSYFDEIEDKIDVIINLFKKESTDFTEIVATLYACAVELLNHNHAVDESNLLKSFYKWSKEKARFDKPVVLSAWRWMNTNQIIPA